MVIRLDDISFNTDFIDLKYQILELRKLECELIFGITVFSKLASNGAVYPDLPIKDKNLDYLYTVSDVIDLSKIVGCGIMDNEIASHGLFHVKHSDFSRDAQEMSIVSSCKFLDTKRFIPPFNYYNNDTLDICEKNGIELINNRNKFLWKSLEVEQFDPKHKYWYYHPWRINALQLEEKLNASENDNKLQEYSI